MPGMKGTMHEFKEGTLHSGSKKGPVVKSRAQAIAIGLNSGSGPSPKGKHRATHKGTGGQGQRTSGKREHGRS
jgi:hypothetical protein